jgi:hypothetical protein
MWLIAGMSVGAQYVTQGRYEVRVEKGSLVVITAYG